MTQVSNSASLGLLAIAGVKPYELKKGEEYMNDAQKAHFTKILKAWHAQIMEEAERIELDKALLGQDKITKKEEK